MLEYMTTVCPRLETATLATMHTTPHFGTLRGADLLLYAGLVSQTPDPVLFLELVQHTWDAHCNQMSTIRSIFLYLDRTYVIQSGNVTSLWEMGLMQFRRHLEAAPEVPSPHCAARCCSGGILLSPSHTPHSTRIASQLPCLPFRLAPSPPKHPCADIVPAPGSGQGARGAPHADSEGAPGGHGEPLAGSQPLAHAIVARTLHSFRGQVPRGQRGLLQGRGAAAAPAARRGSSPSPRPSLTLQITPP